MGIGCGAMRSLGRGLGGACVLLVMAQSGRAGEAQIVQKAVDTFARAALQQGAAVGIAVGVVDKAGAFSQTYTFGYADVAGKKAFAKDSIFEIASNTKVFTTNLLGQAVSEGTLQLADPLSHFAKELGTPQQLETGEITLEELGDFTAGFPDYPPLCPKDKKKWPPGCRPSARPTIADYGADRFLGLFRNSIPMDYDATPPKPAMGLPAPYFYSNYSTGLLGLLLGTAAGKPATDASVDGWYNAVDQKILRPLGMTSTFLDVPAQDAGRVAGGYAPAIASAEVTGGRITAIQVLGGGDSYSTRPTVTIAGGGGNGATAIAKIKNHSVDAIDVGSEGSGYIAPASLTLNGGGSTKIARATPIVVGDRVTAIEVLSGGAGYQQAPKVTISGGHKAVYRDAKAIATIANGRVVSFTLTDQGVGYVPPLSVTVAPGDPHSNVVPIWAPAGALKSTIADMTRFAAAALTEGAASPNIPVSLTTGFKIAEMPYACAAADPDLNSCKDCPNNCAATSNRSGLAWAILPADDAVPVPQIVTKNGALPGFSSQIFLMPSRQLAVVVLVNSASSATGPTGPLVGAPAQVLAFNIGYTLSNTLPLRGTQ